MTSLSILMGNHPHAVPIKKGEIRSSTLTLDFADEPVPHEAFKPFVRELKFDCGELALGTFLQARSFGKPLAILPITISSRFHHGSISYNSERGRLVPKDLEGKSVAVRIYAQATCLWVRGVLRHEYGLDDRKVTWVTFDDSHLAEYRDPPNCVRAPAGKQPETMLAAGEVEAAIPISLASTALQDPKFKTVIPEPDKAARAWYEKYRAIPINHMLIIRESVLESNPDAVRELYRLFVEGKRTLPPPKDGIDMLPVGFEATRRGLDLVCQYAYEQRIVPKRYDVDELFAPALKVLGSGAN